MSNLILAIGGSRSGKSSFAEQMAWSLGGNQVTYLATAQALDAEMQQRINKHKLDRPSRWPTIEEPLEVLAALQRGQGKAILLDCLTLWVSNLMGQNLTESDILHKARQLAQACAEHSLPVIVVSNELGMGLVPGTPLGREYRDVIGRVNQIFADCAREVYFVTAGIPIELKALSRSTVSEAYLTAKLPQEEVNHEL